MSPIRSSLLLGAGAAAGSYQIQRSLRCNSSDSASLSRASYAGSGTFSCWVKRCKLGTAQTIISGIAFNASDQLNSSTAVFRDPSAWMHVLVSTSGTYVNGTSVASGSAITPGIIGSGCDLYLADIYFIDGQALTPSSFTEVSATTGQLIPKAYTGSYGTNGFHLPFSDNSTAAALGTDTSGNGNNWTPNNFSVTAGAGNDSLVDTPTSYGTDTSVGGEVRGNYATLNPLAKGSDVTLVNGNLDCSTSSTAGYSSVLATIGVTSGKWYWEFIAGSGTLRIGLGIATQAHNLSTWLGGDAYGWEYFNNDGSKYTNGSGGAYGAAWTTGDVIGVALDADAGTLTFYKNGTTQGQAYSGLTSGPYFPAVADSGTAGILAGSFNFGQRAFAYTAPSGFKALVDTNLTSTTITTSGTYTGNGVADGPFVYLNGVPTAMTIGGNAVTFGTHADKLANGFKIRTSSTTYNQNASSYNYSITSTDAAFKNARAQPNP